MPRLRNAPDSHPSAADHATVAALDAIRRLVRTLRVAARQVEGRAGISAAQHFVLAQLRDGAAHSIGELAERTLTDRTSVAAVVGRLEEQALVTRERGAADRRRWEVRITTAGRRLVGRRTESPTAQLMAALASLSVSERRALARILTHLLAGMENADEPATMLFADTPGGARAPSGPIERARPHRRGRRD